MKKIFLLLCLFFIPNICNAQQQVAQTDLKASISSAASLCNKIYIVNGINDDELATINTAPTAVPEGITLSAMDQISFNMYVTTMKNNVVAANKQLSNAQLYYNTAYSWIYSTTPVFGAQYDYDNGFYMDCITACNNVMTLTMQGTTAANTSEGNMSVANLNAENIITLLEKYGWTPPCP